MKWVLLVAFGLPACDWQLSLGAWDLCVSEETWFLDADGDGFGDPASPVDACSAPRIAVEQGTDCNDRNDAVHPDQPEICNGIDDDCDSLVDDDDDGVVRQTPVAVWIDADGDGYGDPGVQLEACEVGEGQADNGGDCDDDDPGVHPDHDERCDGIDDDCDGLVDEGFDADGDGHLDQVACGALGDDCDDENPAANPDATEICDGIDDDCDGLIDDDDDGLDRSTASTWYTDADGDGYGDGDSAAKACRAPAGYVGSGTDCDDGDERINPGETEVCGDGRDNDCDGTGAGCPLMGSATYADADASHAGISAGDHMGAAMSSAGDTNGDGIDDLLVGATAAEEGGATDAGSAYLYLGSATGLVTTAAATMSGVKTGDLFGWSVDSAGDTDGDGYGDVVVSTYNAGGATSGAAYVFYGPMSGNTVASAANAVFTPTLTTTYFGWRAVGAGDIDGAGIDDLLVTAPGKSLGGGIAYVYLGPLTGSISTTDADATLSGLAGGDWTGGAASAPGDLDGDGLDDIAVSAEGHDVGYPDAGQVYIWLGALSGDLDFADADVTITGLYEIWFFGWEQSAAGDTNGDGYLDFAVSSPAPSSNTGQAWLFLGPLSIGTWSASLADATFEGVKTSEFFGQTVRGEGDVDADGNDDLAITATSGSSGAGAAHLFYGPMSGSYLSTDADFTVTGSSDSALGVGVAINGDYNADGYDDIAVGAPYDSSSAAWAGAFYLFYPPDW